MIFKQRKKLVSLLLIALFAVITISGITIYNSLRFQIVNIDPPNNKIATSQKSIIITFNKNLQKVDNPIKYVESQDIIIDEVLQEDQRIAITLNRLVQKDEEINISLVNIESIDGEILNKDLKFTGTYIKLANLSEEEIKRQTQQSDSFEDFSLTKVLPKLTTDYEIKYRYPDAEDNKMAIVVTTLKLPEDPTAPIGSESMNKVIRESRTKAINWLNENGYNNENYKLEFSEPVLLEEFGGSLTEARIEYSH